MDTSPTVTDADREAQVESREVISGNILDVIRHLLPATRERDQVLEIVGRVLADNETLQRQLAKLLLHAKKNEGVSTLQLRLALGALGIAASMVRAAMARPSSRQSSMLRIRSCARPRRSTKPRRRTRRSSHRSNRTGEHHRPITYRA